MEKSEKKTPKEISDRVSSLVFIDEIVSQLLEEIKIRISCVELMLNKIKEDGK